MPRRRTGDEQEVRPFRPTCGRCDDGWLHFAFRVTDWFDGKKRTEIVYGPSETPLDRAKLSADVEENDRRIRHYMGVRRCFCMAEPVVVETAQEPMPERVSRGMRRLGL